MQNAKRAESMTEHAFSQFEVTSKLLRNLYKLDLTPITKLVLLELTTHLNESKNGSVVFPSVGYIAEVLGIGLTASKKAINDLIKQGLIIKSKREKVSGNHNKYLLTPKVQNITSEQPEKELFKQPENDLLLIRTNNNEQRNNKTVKYQPVKNTSKKQSGGNVYQGDDAILADYAQKHKARNVDAYINTLKASKSADKIIQEYKKKRFVNIRAERNYNESQALLKQYKSFEKDACLPSENKAWLELGNKIKALRG